MAVQIVSKTVTRTKRELGERVLGKALGLLGNNPDKNAKYVLKAIDQLEIADNTIVFWCTDNGAERRRPWRGSAGPWNGFYNTAMEGGIRTPCVMRWPARIPAGR